MAAAVRAGPRLRGAVEGEELAGLPAELREELRDAVGSEGGLVPFSLLRRLHSGLREAGGLCGACSAGPRRRWCPLKAVKSR